VHIATQNELLTRPGIENMWAKKPAIARWLELIRAHKAYVPTYYFGSLLTERFPHLKARKLSA